MKFKNIFIVALIIIISFISLPADALYRVTDFIGGCASCLDVIPGNKMNAKSQPAYAIVSTTPEHSTYPSKQFVYLWDTDAGCSESVPDYIIPDTNAGDGCWVRLGVDDLNTCTGFSASDIDFLSYDSANDCWESLSSVQTSAGAGDAGKAIRLSSAGDIDETMINDADISHDSTSGLTANNHHNEDHTVASHSDTDATGPELNELTDGSLTDKHVHDKIVGSDGSPDPACSTDADGKLTCVDDLTVGETVTSDKLRDSGNIIPNYLYTDFGGDNLYLRPHPLIENPVIEAGDIANNCAGGGTIDFVADPFPYYKNGVYYIYFEVGCTGGTSKNYISYVTSPDGLTYTDSNNAIIISASVNYTFPVILGYRGSDYILVKNGVDSQIEIWKETSPGTWVLFETLCSSGCDTTLPNANDVPQDPVWFPYQDRFWLVWSEASGGGSGRADEVHAYWSYDPIGGTWTAHTAAADGQIKNGDEAAARPAGRPISRDFYLIFFYQDGLEHYGDKVRAYKWTTLTPTTFAETEYTSSPLLEEDDLDSWRSEGLHTLNIMQTSFGNAFAVVDGHDSATGADGFSIGIFEVAPEKFSGNYDFLGTNISCGSDNDTIGTRTDNANKRCTISTPSRDIDEPEIAFIELGQTANLNLGKICGGNTKFNPCTSLGVYTAATNTENSTTNPNLFLDGFLTDLTGDEEALELSYTINKATSGDVFGLKLTPTNTAVPGDHYGIYQSDITAVGATYGYMLADGTDGYWLGTATGTGIASKTTSMTVASLADLENTPIELAPARAGTINEFVSAMLIWDRTTAVTCTNADNKFRIRYNDGAGTIVSEAIDMNTFIEGAGDAIRWMDKQATSDTELISHVNQVLVLHNEGTGDCSGGSGSFKVKLNYKMHTTQL